jgi:hypothetical protein
MNENIPKRIREACVFAKSQDVAIKRGLWFELGEDRKIIACDPLGAVLLKSGVVNFKSDVPLITYLSNPGFVKAICEILNINGLWLRQFWSGFDQGHQVFMIDDKDKLHEDEVSRFGIQLSKELLVLK